MKRPERETTPEYLKWLDDHGVWAWRTNSGTVRVGSRTIKLGEKGMPDIAGILPGGRSIFVENKSNGSVLTPEQVAWHKKAIRQGAHVIVAFSLEDIVNYWETVINGRHKQSEG